MAVTSVALTDPVSGLTVQIWPAPGVSGQILDVSAPARAVEEDRAGASGSYDVTRFASAAAVSLSLLLWPSGAQHPENFLDAIGPLLAPGLRPYLIVTNDQWPTPRQLAVRYDSMSKPLSSRAFWPVQISWKAPAGRWESAVLTSAVLQSMIASTTGFEFDPSTGAVVTSAGYVFPATSQLSPSQVTSGGNTASDWQALLYGPCSGPRLANDTAGLSVNFTTGLTLALGDYVLLDSATHTAFLNSDPSVPVTQFLDFASSSWWLMQPGLNILRYWPVAADSGAQATLNFKAAWAA